MVKLIQLADVVRALTSNHERFPHERRIAVITFGAFLQFPDQPQMIARAACFGAASVVRALHRGKLAPHDGNSAANIQMLGELFFSPVEISDLLLDHDENELSFSDMYDGNNADLGTVQAIAAFLLMCPAELKPSINKALFFIDHDGFRVGRTIEKWRFGKASPTTSKKAWKMFGRVSAFLLAENELDLPFDILSPDTVSVRNVDELLNHGNFENFFPVAATLQRRLISLLGKENRVVRQFFTLPKDVVQRNQTLPIFSGEQLDLIRRYRAPVPSQ